MIFDFDSIIIGAGVVGLSIARSLAVKGRQVLVLEANSSVGQGVSSRNSEVIHAGIYYPYESLKRRLCLDGRSLLVRYCESHKIDYKQVGKLIIANKQDDLTKLSEIMDRGLRNGVKDLRMVFQDELSELEPSIRARQGILSPSTGIIDSHGLMLALQGDVEKANGVLCFNSRVSEIRLLQSGFSVRVASGDATEVTCRELINSTGLNAQEVSRTIKGFASSSIPRSMYCKGSYFTLTRRSPFDHLIYPVPNDAGLGIHLTLDLAGRAKFGPDVEWVDEPDYNVSADRKNEFITAIKDYYPSLNDTELIPDYAGVRPKIVSANEPAADFSIQFSDRHSVPGYVALYGIESPGLTSALAIGDFIEQRL